MLDLNSIDFISQSGSMLTTISSMFGGNSSISSYATGLMKNQGIIDLFGFLTDKKTVALFDEDNKEVLANCDIHTVDIKDEARLADQPLEDGTNISDHKVFLQKEAEILVYLPESDYSTAVSELYDLYTNNKFLKLQAKSMVLSNMQIVGLPHNESNQNIYRMVYRVQLKEAITIKYSIRGYHALGSGNATAKFTNNPLEEGRSLDDKVVGGIIKAIAKGDESNPEATTAFEKGIQQKKGNLKKKGNLMIS